MQPGQQIVAGICKEDPDQGHQFPAYGEHSEVPGRRQSLRLASRRNFPDCRFIRKKEHFTGTENSPFTLYYYSVFVFYFIKVALSLYALGRITQKHPEYNGPSLGPKMADENKRTFTEEQLRAHEGELNLQMGYNKGASQSGHGGFGNTRHM